MNAAPAGAAGRAMDARMLDYLLGRPQDSRDGEGDANEAALARYRLVPRLMTGAADIDIGVRMPGRRVPAPLAVGAYAADRLLTPEGILPVARVCSSLGLPLFVSEECLTPLAAIADLHDHCWLQIRAAGPRERALRMAEAAARAGARGILLTALAPVHPRPGLKPGGIDIAAEIAARGLSTIGAESGVAALPAFPAWTWDDVAALADGAGALGLPLMVKGVLDPRDAVAAIRAGAGGLMVSNVGLRQSARWIPAVECLRSVREAVGPEPCIVLDGGIRNGADLVVARILGADLAAVVRPAILALAGGGEAGLHASLSAMIDQAAALASWMGAACLDDLGPEQAFRL